MTTAMTANPACPGPECPYCSGELCYLCSGYDADAECNHDVIDRHPPMTHQAKEMPTAARTLALSVSEREFTDSVIKQAQILGWICAHFRPARVQRGDMVSYRTPVQGDGKGFPDLVLVKFRTIYIELKSERGVIETAQVRWLDALDESGCATTYLWHPSDADEIARIFREERAQRWVRSDTEWHRRRESEIARMPKRSRDALGVS